MLNLQNYGSSSEDEDDNDIETRKQNSNEGLLTHLKPVDPSLSVAKTIQICSAPVVVPTVSINDLCRLSYANISKHFLLIFCTEFTTHTTCKYFQNIILYFKYLMFF